MPEGHTIHRLARGLSRTFHGRTVAASTLQQRFADGAAALDGSTLVRAEAHGKHLFATFRDGTGPDRRLHVHLGLYGRFPIEPGPAPAPRGQLRLRLATVDAWADLRGPTACELISREDRRMILDRLGPDPLRPDADPDLARRRIVGSSAPIGRLLMDQQVLSGIGNVYRAEVLFRSGIDPYRPGRRLDPAQWDAMWTDLRSLMRAGARVGRIVTTRPDDRPRKRTPVPREDSFYVYGRSGEPCRLCGTPVATAVLAARNLFWCPACQPA